MNNMKNERKNVKTKSSNKRIWVVILFLIVTIIAAFIALRGSYLEKLEIGEKYVSVFWKNFEYKTITILITFATLFFAMFAANKRIAKGLKDFFDDEKKEMPKLPNKSISLIISVIVSVCTANITTNKLILFLNSASFQMEDKIFGNDMSYYLFQKPFIEYVLWFGIIALVAITAYMGIYYIVALNTQFAGGVRSETLKTSKIIKQILGNTKVLSILIAILTFFKTQDLSSSKFLTIGDKSSYSLYGARVNRFKHKALGI